MSGVGAGIGVEAFPKANGDPAGAGGAATGAAALPPFRPVPVPVPAPAVPKLNKDPALAEAGTAGAALASAAGINVKPPENGFFGCSFSFSFSALITVAATGATAAGAPNEKPPPNADEAAAGGAAGVVPMLNAPKGLGGFATGAPKVKSGLEGRGAVGVVDPMGLGLEKENAGLAGMEDSGCFQERDGGV